MSATRTPHRLFVEAFAAALNAALEGRYKIMLFGSVPTKEAQCPRATLDFFGSSPVATTARRDRCITSRMRLLLKFHKWIEKIDSDNDATEQAFALLDEYDLNKLMLLNVLRDFRQGEGLPAGLQTPGAPDITGTTFALDVNTRKTVITSTFLIQNLPLEYTTTEA